MRSGRHSGGFTLLEVMIALAILAGGLLILLSASAANVGKTKRAQALGIATDLARGKMYDIEEKLLDEGFQQLDETLDGDFTEEGWPQFTWTVLIEKVELPGLEAMQGVGGAEGEEGAEGKTGEDGKAGEEAPADPGGGLLGGFLGMAGGDGADASMAAGASMIGTQWEMLRNVLQESIRRVTVTVKWQVGGREDKLTINCYFTDPAAVNRLLGGVAGGTGGEEGGAGGGGAGGGGTGSGGTGSGGTGSGGTGSGGTGGGGTGGRTGTGRTGGGAER